MRDIYLYSKDSRAELRDFFVQTSFADRTDKNSDVTMNVDVDVRNLTDKEDTSGYTVTERHGRKADRSGYDFL